MERGESPNVVSWYSREAQPERRATMKRKIYFIVSQLYLAMVFLEHNTDLFPYPLRTEIFN